jgi:type IX secretion system PorP/SprF family membrane protein
MKKNQFITGMKFGIAICLMAISNTIFAQDPNFSQYFASPLTLNPSLIGKGTADWRVTTLYRNQWFGNTNAQPYTTATVSLEKRINQNKSPNDQLAFGVVLLNDASNNGLLKNNYISLGMAYNNALDREGNLLLGGGISFTYRNRLLDPSKFIFQSQFGSGGYQPGIGITDGVNIVSNSFLDINAGLNLSERKEKWGYNFGLSYYHAANPQDGAYLQNQFSLNPRISFQSGLQFYFKNQSELDISIISNHQKSINDLVTIGAQYKIHVPDNLLGFRTFNLGVWKHVAESLTTYVGLEASKNWLFGISYDIINADISYGSNSMQSIECSFIWQFAGKNNKEHLPKVKSVVIY